MALTDSAIRAAKSKDKPYKLYDDGGLFLLIAASGSKLWRLKYRFSGHVAPETGVADVNVRHVKDWLVDALPPRPASQMVLAS